MDITIELRSGADTITFEPASCSITMAVCNDSLQHVENFCEAKLVYDPDLFSFIVSHEQADAIVKKSDGAILFTGIAGADASWTDQGEPFPVQGLSLSIKDYTAKLDIQNGYEIAFLNASLAAVINQLVSDCDLTLISGQIPVVTLEAFVMPSGQNYRQTLDALCYQYQICFYFDKFGVMNFFHFGDIPASSEQLSDSDILAGVKVRKSRKRYDRVAVDYSTLTQKENEQVYFESFGYDSDNTPSPMVLQPGVYYPFDAAPEIEATEGKVYQSFVGGYAESRKKYNGELEYRRSKDTSLLYTHNHRITEDWEGSIEINRTEFESQRAAVRFRNTGDTDANIRQFAIRADAIYRDKSASIIAGSGSADRTFTTDAAFIYNAARAEDLAKTLYRFFSRSCLGIEFGTDTLAINQGSYRAVDTGKSGLIVEALVYSRALDCEKETYTYKAVSVGPAAVDVSRFKSAESNPFKGEPGKSGEAGQYTDYRFAKNTSVTTAPSCSVNVDNPGINWTDTPPVISTNEYLWMIQADWRGASRLSAWSVPVRISGPAGNSGQNAVYLNIENENRSIVCDSEGIPKPGSLGFNVHATVYDGTSAVTGTDAIWDIVTDVDGVSINNDGTIEVSGSSVLGDTALITVVALYKGAAYYATLTLNKVRDGSHGLDGADAVYFDLQPSVSVIKKGKDGSLDPPSITCGQFRYEGDQITISHELLRYRLSTMQNEVNYSGEINIGDAAWVEFVLYGGSGLILDRERVPVLEDGIDGINGNYYEPRYQRSPNQPPTPVGNEPEGWSTQPPIGADLLWMIRGLKNPNGILLETKYRNDPLWDGWSKAGTGTVINDNGILYISGNAYILRITRAVPGDIVIIKARQIDGPLGSLQSDTLDGLNTSGHGPAAYYGTLSREWKTFIFILKSGQYGIQAIYRNNYTIEGTLEISVLHIGNSQTLPPDGLLYAGWSDPIQISGEPGLGIEAIPCDPSAYWSCDELPDMPDDPAGVYVKLNYFSGLPSGWAWNNPGASNIVSYIDGRMVITGGNGIYRPSIPAGYNVCVVKLKVYEGLVYAGKLGAENRVGVGEHIVASFRANGSNVTITPNMSVASFEIISVYIGTGAFLTSLTDNSGNKYHIPLLEGVVANEGRWSKGLKFLPGYVETYIPNILFHGNFSLSFWGKFDKLTGDISLLGNWPGFYLETSNTLLKLNWWSGVHGVYDLAPNMPVNTWTHILLRKTGGNITCFINGEPRLSHNNLPPILTEIRRLIIGNRHTDAAPTFTGSLDEVAIFDRALSDNEIYALYKTTPEKKYTHADWMVDEQNPDNVRTPHYLGAAISSSTTNRITLQTATSTQIAPAHIGDWVSYVGTTSGIWVKGMCMRWSGISWEQVLISESDKYMAALEDLFEGAPNAAFSAAFIENLFVQTVNAKMVNVWMKLLVGSGLDGILIDSVGKLIRSMNYVSGSKGWIIRNDKLNGIQSEFTDIKTVNMKAENADLEGIFVAGDAWNSDGSTKNANSFGGILAKGSTAGSSPIRIKNLEVYGDVALGMTMGTPGKIIFYSIRQASEKNFLMSGPSNQLRGNFNRSSLYSALVSLFEKFNNTNGGFFPVCGSVTYYTLNSVPPQANIISVSYIKKISNVDYRIYGTRSDGTLIGMQSNSSQFLVWDDSNVNDAGTTLLNLTSTSAQNSNIKLDLMFT